MGNQNHDFKKSVSNKLDIGSREHQIREELLKRISNLEKELEDVKRVVEDEYD